MANGQTANYALNQWAASDQVLRTEFNADNSKIDAALAKKFGTDNASLKVGTYTGNGGDSITVTTGFQPSLVIILSLSASGSYDYGLMIGNGTGQFLETMFNSRVIHTDALQCTSTGFTVTHQPVSSSYVGFNTEGCTCLYFAFR